MSKAAAIAATGVGGGGAAFGGYLIFTNGGGGSGEKGEAETADKTTTQTPEETSTLIFKDLAAFQKGSKDDVCVKEVLGTNTLDLTATSTEGSDSAILKNDQFFGTAASENVKGCLAINYEKAKEGENKLTGTFTWTWIFINNDKGFVNFNVAKSADNNQLKLTGGFYLIEKGTGDTANTWKVKWKEEVTTEDKAVTVTDSENKFPKKKANSKVEINGEDYWGFVDDTGAVKALTDTSKSPELKRWSWKWESATGDDKVGIGEWSDNLKWWEHLYSSSKEFKLSEKLANFKGTWTELSKSTES